jgi:hypothetical protein
MDDKEASLSISDCVNSVRLKLIVDKLSTLKTKEKPFKNKIIK